MSRKNKNTDNTEESSLKKVNIFEKIKRAFINFKNRAKTNVKTVIHMNKADLFTQIFSTRYFILFIFIIILLKTILFSADTIFYKEGIWLWYIRQTAFFIFIMIAPMFAFRKSRARFRYGMILNFLISVLLLADEIYYLYASNIISVMQARKFAIYR